MTRLENKLRSTLARLGITRSDRIVVGVSGGADSVSLLCALAHWKGSLIAAHLNHMLRGDESDEDQNFVSILSGRLRIPCIEERRDVGALVASRKSNLEATARELRYEFFERTAREHRAKYIFTAHTRDDQSETLLMRLVRGTGVSGWKGIHESLELESDLRVIRPFLNVSRTEILDHCRIRGIDYRSDSSNECLDFTRNRMRLTLLPLLRQFNPEFDDALINLAAEATQNVEILALEARNVVSRHGTGKSIKVSPLRELEGPVRRLALREWLRVARGDLKRISRPHLEALERLVTTSEGGSYVELPGGQQVALDRGSLKLQPSRLD